MSEGRSNLYQKEHAVVLARHRGTPNMGIAYTIEKASEATSLTEHAIRLAIKEGRLEVRVLDGQKLLLRTDIQTWLETLPRA